MVAVVNRIVVDADIGSTFERAIRDITGLLEQAQQLLPLLLLAVLVDVASWLLAKVVAIVASAALAKRIGSPLLLGVIVRALSIPVFLLGVYFVLRVAGLTQLALTVLGGTGLIGTMIDPAKRSHQDQQDGDEIEGRQHCLSRRWLVSRTRTLVGGLDSESR